MLRFHWQLVRRAPDLLWTSTDRYLKATAIISFLVALLNRPVASVAMNAVTGFSPFWALIPVGLFFLYGLMKANHKRFQQVEQERDEFKEQIKTREPQTVSDRSERPRTVTVEDHGTRNRVVNSSLEVGGGYAGDVFGVISKGTEGTVHGFEVRQGVDKYTKIAEAASRGAVRGFYSKRISDEELTQHCLILSKEVYEFLAARERNSPHLRLWFEGMHLSTEEEKQEHWERRIEETERYFDETINQYKKSFHGRAVALLYAATERSACPPEEFSRLDHPPVNTHAIEDMAGWLAAIGHRP